MIPNFFFKNPIIKCAGIIIILYYALFSSENNENALNKRFSVEKISKAVVDISNKKEDIHIKLERAKKDLRRLEDLKAKQNKDNIKEQIKESGQDSDQSKKLNNATKLENNFNKDDIEGSRNLE